MTTVFKKYDLEERTFAFSKGVILLIKSLPINDIGKPMTNQLIRSATSIGANYTEANGASSRKDFRNKIFICKKESGETKYWLRLLAECFPEKKNNIRSLWKEAQELTLIFQKIITSMKI